jgi:hypothetical protein
MSRSRRGREGSETLSVRCPGPSAETCPRAVDHGPPVVSASILTKTTTARNRPQATPFARPIRRGLPSATARMLTKCRRRQPRPTRRVGRPQHLQIQAARLEFAGHSAVDSRLCWILYVWNTQATCRRRRPRPSPLPSEGWAVTARRASAVQRVASRAASSESTSQRGSASLPSAYSEVGSGLIARSSNNSRCPQHTARSAVQCVARSAVDVGRHDTAVDALMARGSAGGRQRDADCELVNEARH